MLESLVARWGYAAILAGTFLEGETVLLAGGAMAHRGLLSLPWVIACALVASFAGDQMWFFLGRRYGPRALERRPGWAAPAESRAGKVEERVLVALGVGVVIALSVRHWMKRRAARD